MRLLVTGAGGFVGRYVVASALRRGHEVVAVARASRGGVATWGDPPPEGLSLARLDLRQADRLEESLSGVDAVLHLAATMGGDLYDQLVGTVRTTEILLEAMDRVGPRRIVLVSSFSVYDYRRAGRFRRFDETAAVERDARRRDAYALTKLWQERLVREHAEARGWAWTVLRPGAIYGKDHLWTARLGQAVGGRLWLRIGQASRLPLTYVENCAEAIVMAAERPEAAGQVLNVVDDAPPTQRAYARRIGRLFDPRPRTIVVPRAAGRLLASTAGLANAILFRGQARMPGLLVTERFDARFKPLRYSNARIKAVLAWQPRYSLDEALGRCGRPEAELLAVTPPAGPAVVPNRGTIP